MHHTKKINFIWHKSHCFPWSYLLLLTSGLDRWARLTEVQPVSYPSSLPSEHGKFFWARIYKPAERGYTKERRFLKHKHISLSTLSLTSSFRSTQMQLYWVARYFLNGKCYGLLSHVRHLYCYNRFCLWIWAWDFYFHHCVRAAKWQMKGFDYLCWICQPFSQGRWRIKYLRKLHCSRLITCLACSESSDIASVLPCHRRHKVTGGHSVFFLYCLSFHDTMFVL